MDEFVALIGFSVVSSVTPGPNNILLWASGATFGLQRSLPHIAGTAAGIGAMAVAVAAGLAALITTVPWLEFAMKLGGSLYLLYLAYQIAGAAAIERRTVTRPLGFAQAAAFQLINPKAWVFALGAVTTFRPAELPIVVGSVLVAVTMMIVTIPTAGLWAAGGSLISPLLTNERRHRIVSGGLAALLAGTVIYVWL